MHSCVFLELCPSDRSYRTSGRKCMNFGMSECWIIKWSNMWICAKAVITRDSISDGAEDGTGTETTVSEDLHQSRQAGNSHFQALKTSRRGNGTAWGDCVVYNARLPTRPQTSTAEAWHSSESININSDASWAPTSDACACGTYIRHANGTRGKFTKLIWSNLLVGSLTIP
jgi:hypothetical protein